MTAEPSATSTAGGNVPTAAKPGLVSCRSLPWMTGIVFAIGLLVAPHFKNEFDVLVCWLGWARASGGVRPWDIYLQRPDCNYSPFVLYILTAAQAIIDAFAWPQNSNLSIGLIKLPNLIAFAATAWIIRRSLGPIIGASRASGAACVYALCLPIWFNAAVWGQWDAILCLAMLAAVIGMLRDRPAWSGAAAGWALAIKLQAIVIVPALLVYAARRWGLSAVARWTIAAALVWAAIVGPFVAAGAGKGVRESYTGAVNKYPLYSVCAFNSWMLAQTYSSSARNWPTTFGRYDTQRVLGAVTAKQLGLVCFGVCIAFVLWRLGRCPTRVNLVFAAALSAYAFYMLPTQMHERYVLPACALLALFATSGAGTRLYLAVAVPAMLNQLVALGYQNRQGRGALSVETYHTFQTASLWLSAVNVGLFLWITWRYFWQTDKPDGMAPLNWR